MLHILWCLLKFLVIPFLERALQSGSAKWCAPRQTLLRRMPILRQKSRQPNLTSDDKCTAEQSIPQEQCLFETIFLNQTSPRAYERWKARRCFLEYPPFSETHFLRLKSNFFNLPSLETKYPSRLFSTEGIRRRVEKRLIGHSKQKKGKDAEDVSKANGVNQHASPFDCTPVFSRQSFKQHNQRSPRNEKQRLQRIHSELRL